MIFHENPLLADDSHENIIPIFFFKLGKMWLNLSSAAVVIGTLRVIFDFTTAGDWDCVAAVERLPTLHYCVDFIFLSFGIMDFIWEL